MGSRFPLIQVNDIFVHVFGNFVNYRESDALFRKPISISRYLHPLRNKGSRCSVLHVSNVARILLTPARLTHLSAL